MSLRLISMFTQETELNIMIYHLQGEHHDSVGLKSAIGKAISGNSVPADLIEVQV